MKRIDMTEIMARRAKLEAAFKAAQSAVETAQESLDELAEEVTERILKGETTGDPLTDEIIMMFRFDYELLTLFTGWNNLLQKKKGEELMLLVPWNKCVGGTTDDPQDAPALGVVLGTLSGERLSFVLDVHRAVVMKIPVTKFVMTDFESTQDEEFKSIRRDRDFRVENYSFSLPSIAAITEELRDQSTSFRCRILIGDEIKKAEIPSFNLRGRYLPHRLSVLRQLLQAPSDKELLEAAAV